jgi:uncharacterized protein YkwD
MVARARADASAMRRSRFGPALVCAVLAACATVALATAEALPSTGARAHHHAKLAPAKHHWRWTCTRHANHRAASRHSHLRARTVRCWRSHARSLSHSHTRAGARHRRHASHHTAHRHPAASSSTCADASITPLPENLARVRAAILCLINHERTSVGEGALASSPALEAAAQQHTDEMAFGDYFEHVGPNGDTPVARARANGYLDGALGYEVGENIAYGTGWLATPRAIVSEWMSSPGHRANILNTRFRDTGVGVSAHPPASLAGGQRGAIYTQDFGVTLR